MVCEALRTFTGHSFTLPHRALKDTTLFGYFIPKNATVAINLHGLHMNEELWEDPWSFKPERFLGPDGKLDVPEYFAPFGFG
jgi:cytochrome P450